MVDVFDFITNESYGWTELSETQAEQEVYEEQED